MPSSSGHVRKRQYQPSIDSHFSRDANSNGIARERKPSTPLSPPLPVETQASLLSVGMRVRKSVPEGYKTHKTLGLPESPVPSTAPPASSARQTPRNKRDLQRELVPFCGLHKTGGWAAQEIPSSSAPAAMQTDEDDEYDLPDLTTSQSTLMSIPSSSTMPPSSKKRNYDEDIEDDLDAYFDNDAAMDGAASYFSRDERPMARMKQSSSHRMGRGVRVAGADDFDEAAFLVPEDMVMDEF